MRLLFIAFPDSIHTVRWTNLVSSLGWDVHLIAATDAPLHPGFRNVTVYHPWRSRPRGLDASVRVRWLWPAKAGNVKARELARRCFPRLAGRWVWESAIIRRLKPDILHSLEFQHAGYAALGAKQRLGARFPTWIATNWGSDVYLFGRLAAHRERVRAILEGCDYYGCECERDVALARELGLRGRALPVMPNTGGFDLEQAAKLRRPGPTSARRLILVKGYQNFAGRALVALQAIARCARELEGYRVALYSGSEDVEVAAELASQATGIPIEIVPPSPHEEMLRLYGQARIYIGLSISDAISTSLLESIVMGAFPIQSCTACADEWIVNGRTGFIVPPEDPETVAEAIRCAVADDALVDRAAEENAKTAAARLDNRVLQPRIREMYEQIYAERRKRAPL